MMTTNQSTTIREQVLTTTATSACIQPTTKKRNPTVARSKRSKIDFFPSWVDSEVLFPSWVVSELHRQL